MKYKDFAPDLWSQIDSAIDESLKNDAPPVAAFDADGTLWDTDLGENFFKFQIRHQLLPGLPKDPWTHYREQKMKDGNPRPAYLWLAQINSGLQISQVRAWAEQAVNEYKPLPIFDPQRKLIDKLHSKGVHVYVVTASIKWAVEPGARRLGIPQERVLGVETMIQNGLVTDQAFGHMTYREGKSEALLAATQGHSPFLCSGNTPGDLFLLRAATHIQLAVGGTQPGHELYSTEEKFRTQAKEQGWLIHRF